MYSLVEHLLLKHFATPKFRHSHAFSPVRRSNFTQFLSGHYQNPSNHRYCGSFHCIWQESKTERQQSARPNSLPRLMTRVLFATCCNFYPSNLVSSSPIEFKYLLWCLRFKTRPILGVPASIFSSKVHHHRIIAACLELLG